MESSAASILPSDPVIESRVSSRFVLRVAGLPIEAVECLRMDRASDWVQSVLDLESELGALADPLVDEVFAAIAGEVDQTLRRQLIRLKREVFNRRFVGAPEGEAADALLAALPASGRALLERWWQISKRLDEQMAAGEETYAREIALKRQALKAAVIEPDFHKGLLLASPQLGQGLRRYLASDDANLSRRSRLVERSVYQYLQRTSCKTSPFSTFTAVAAGSIEDQLPQGTALVEYTAADMAKASFVRLDVSYLARLASRLIENGEIRPLLRVQLVAGWSLAGGKLRYLRRTESERQSPQALVNMLHENVLRLPTGNLMKDLIELLDDERRLPFGRLVEELSDGDERSQEKVELYLLHLLRLGVLVYPDLRIDVHSANPLATYRRALVDLGHPIATSLAERVGHLEGRLEKLAAATALDRAALLVEIRELLQACFGEVGAPDEEISATPIFEDTILAPVALRLNRPALAEILDDLGDVQALASLFDFNLPRRLATKGFFRARFPAGSRIDDLLKFAEEFHHDFFEQFGKRSMRGGGLDADRRLVRLENALKMPEVDALNAARQDFADYMSELNRQRSEDSLELTLDRDKVRRILAALPSPEPIEAHAFFCQLGLEDGEPRLTVNRVYAGFGLLFSRFAHFLSQAESGFLSGLRQALHEVQPPGTVFAELQGGYDATNLNLHPVVTDYELECPGDFSQRPAAERIPLADLYIQHDLGDDALKLYSRRLGVQVIPVYLGFLLPVALPEIQQVLLNFAFLPLCPLAVWNGAEAASAEDGVARYPRVRLGDVVLERAMWKMPPAEIPERDPQEGEARYFLRLQRWARQQSIPERVFVTPDSQMGGGRGKAARDSYKPLYIDFRDPFSLALLEQTARKAKDRLVFKEMLPHRDHLWLKRKEGAFVSEFILESYRQAVTHV